ncbi:HEPN domain-containing protein [Pannus brasiliensis]|uniref:HEPN domain-containing protein n=1 Tax=Pannus brasiliensis TaxID=1579216 RepID=UPI003BEEE818
MRATLVLSVSALDYYIHEVVTLGMLEIYRGQRPEPAPSANTSRSAFARFPVSLGGARQERAIALTIADWLETEIQNNEGFSFLEQPRLLSELLPAIERGMIDRFNDTAWLEDEIRENLSYKSFQQPDKIAEAIRSISDKRLWEEVGIKLEKPAREVKQQLTDLVDRRNKIAHEADIDPTFGIGERWELDENLVNDAVDFIEQLAESIHQVIAT